MGQVRAIVAGRASFFGLLLTSSHPSGYNMKSCGARFVRTGVCAQERAENPACRRRILPRGGGWMGGLRSLSCS